MSFFGFESLDHAPFVPTRTILH
uniref:Uncharacterized protein n=1 Tax=Rhizophora mucronata TaxID=61149 RepID=A0A2P2QE36_RHIMU